MTPQQADRIEVLLETQTLLLFEIVDALHSYGGGASRSPSIMQAVASRIERTKHLVGAAFSTIRKIAQDEGRTYPELHERLRRALFSEAAE